jgi:hypothetical protein
VIHHPITISIRVSGDFPMIRALLVSTTLIGVVAAPICAADWQLRISNLPYAKSSSIEAVLFQEKGDDDTDKAVALGLAWIAKQQSKDGSWEFDGQQKTEKAAASAMAVLAFLGSGETHTTGKKYKMVIANGLKYIQSQQKASGQIGGGNTYTHALATIALCEAYGMTRDATLKARAQSAINFIVKAQGKDGGWRYTPNAPAGDTSVFGWQMQALKSAQLAGLVVPKTCFQNAEKYLTTVANEDGSQFGYVANTPPTHTLSAVGLLGKLFLGTSPRNESVVKGVKNIWDKTPPDKVPVNVYYLWYGTLLFNHLGGDQANDWNAALRKALVAKQITGKTPNAVEANIGAWPADVSHIGSSCGKLGTTCLTVLSLQASSGRLPVTKRAAVKEPK